MMAFFTLCMILFNVFVIVIMTYITYNDKHLNEKMFYFFILPLMVVLPLGTVGWLLSCASDAVFAGWILFVVYMFCLLLAYDSLRNKTIPYCTVFQAKFDIYKTCYDDYTHKVYRILLGTIVYKNKVFSVQLVNDDICLPQFDPSKEYDVVLKTYHGQTAYSCPEVRRVSRQ